MSTPIRSGEDFDALWDAAPAERLTGTTDFDALWDAATDEPATEAPERPGLLSRLRGALDRLQPERRDYPHDAVAEQQAMRDYAANYIEGPTGRVLRGVSQQEAAGDAERRAAAVRLQRELMEQGRGRIEGPTGSRPRDTTPPEERDPRIAEQSPVGAAVAAVSRGVGQMVESTGGFVRMLGDSPILPMPPENQIGETIEAAGRRIRTAPSLQPSSNIDPSRVFDPRNPSWWLERGLEQIPQLAVSIGGAVATGGLGPLAQFAAFAAPTFVQEAGSAYQQGYSALRERGLDESAARQGASGFAVLTGAGAAALERIPFGGIILGRVPGADRVFASAFAQRMSASLAGRAVTTGIAEMGEEAAQSAWADVLAYTAQIDPAAFRDWQDRYAAAGALGFGAGAGAGVFVQPNPLRGREQQQPEAGPPPQAVVSPEEIDDPALRAAVRQQQEQAAEPAPAAEPTQAPPVATTEAGGRRRSARATEIDQETLLGDLRALERARETAEADPDTRFLEFVTDDDAGTAAEALREAAREAGAAERIFRTSDHEFVALAPAAAAEPLLSAARARGFTGGMGGTLEEANAALRQAAAEAAPTSEPRQRMVARAPELARPADLEVPENVGYVAPENVDLEPQRFQYKLNTSERGVTRALEGVRQWDENLAGIVQLWRDPQDGRLKVVNGHHRVDLARRLGVPRMLGRVLDVETAEEARMVGALTNIAEGRGTPMDAAKLFRESGMSEAEVRAAGIPLTEATARDGLALAQLAQPLFDRTVRGELSIPVASAIGRGGLTEAQQLDLLKLIERRPARMSAARVEELIRYAKEAPEVNVTQETLFGTEQLAETALLEKAELSAWVKGQLLQDARLARQADRNADRLAELGIAEVDRATATETAGRVSIVAELYTRLSTRGGPIARALDEAARDQKAGGKRAEIRTRLYTAVEQAVRAELDALTGGARAGAARDPREPAAAEPREGAAREPAEAEAPAGVDTETGELFADLTAQDDLFGGPTEFSGEPQRELGIEEDRASLQAAERRARTTIARLQPLIDRNTATPTQREQYREALALLRRSEGQSAEEVRLRAEGTQQDPGDTGDLFGPMLDAPEGDAPPRRQRRAPAATATTENPPMSGASVEANGRTFHPIAPVELARIAAQLLGGTGTTRVFMKRYPTARGAFYPDPTFPRIGLNPELGQDYDQFARTLAHEVGHLIDFDPGQTMSRGNILGRLATLKGYLSETIDRLPTDPSRALTPQDRAQIRRAAEKRVGPKPAKDEEADLAAWREEVSRVYAELIAEEIEARDLLTRERIHEELHLLSMWWRPYDPDAVSAAFRKYRESSPEIYADALSVLLNDPAALQQRAPTFFEAFLAYSERKPDMRLAYDAVQLLIGGGEDVLMEARREEIERDFARGEEIQRAAEDRKDPQGIRSYLKQLFVERGAPLSDAERRRVGRVPAHSSKRAVRMALQEHQHADNVNRLMLMDVQRDVHTPMLEAGITPEQAGRFLMLQRIADGDRGGMAEQAKEAIMELTGESSWPAAKAAYTALGANEETSEQFDPDLLALAETGLLNPRGYTPAEAKRTLAALEKELGAERYAQLEQLMGRFREILFASVETAVAVGSYNAQVYAERILPNRATYAPFAVLDYFNGRVPAGVKRQIGTLKGIANPYTTALLKAMALNRLNEYQRVKLQILKVLDVDFPGMAGAEAKIDKYHREKKPGPDRENLLYLRDGKLHYREVDAYIAKVLEQSDLGGVTRLARAFSTHAYALFHPLYVTWSLGWQVRNIQRDWKRTYKNLAAARAGQTTYRQALGAILDVVRLNRSYVRTMGAAWRNARREHDPLIRAMLKDRALGRAFHSFEPNTEDAKYERLLQQYGLAEPRSEGAKAKIRKLGRVIETLGIFQETWSKAAAYELLGEDGFTAQERAYIVRNYVGTPDSTQRGLASDAVNGVIMYANVIMAGLRADAEVALQPSTAAGYWLRAVLIDFLPKTAMAAAMIGFFGDELEEWMQRIPSYDLEKYLIVPVPPFWSVNALGEKKAVYLRMPHDDVNRILAGSLWALLLSERPHRFARTLGLVSGEFGGVNPALSLPYAWFQVARGKNPEDTFRGRPIVPPTAWEAGGWQRWKELIRYTMGEFGIASQTLGYFTRTSPDESKSTTAETLLRSIPGISALIKVSDRGESERRDWEIEWERQQRAKLRADLSREVRRLVGERAALNRAGVKRLGATERARRAQLNAWYRRYLSLTAAMERARDTDDHAGYERAKAALERSATEINANRPGRRDREARRAEPAAGGAR